MEIPLKIHAVAGFAAGFVSSSVLYPLEVVKSRFQVGTHGKFSYVSTMNALKTMYSLNGFRELYRGFPAGLVGSSLSWGMYFYLYNHWKVGISELRGNSVSGPLDHWVSSVFSSIVVQTLLCPLWVIKLNQQLGQSRGGFWSTGSHLYQTEGYRGMYRGLIPGYWTCSHLAVQFVLYEQLSSFLGTGVTSTIFSTLVSKSIATVLTSPIEVVKVRLRSSKVSVAESIRSISVSIWRAEGLLGFYRGVGPALIRILPAQCLTFVTYEWVKQYAQL